MMNSVSERNLKIKNTEEINPENHLSNSVQFQLNKPPTLNNR